MVWDGSHERFRRGVLVLSFVELLVVFSIVTYVGISLYDLTLNYPSDEPVSGQLSHTHDSHSDGEVNASSPEVGSKGTLCGNDVTDEDGCLNGTSAQSFNVTGRSLPSDTKYFAVIGARIAKSIQFIIYTCQLCMTFVLIRGLLNTDTSSLRTWLIVTEIIATVVLIVLVIYLLGSFITDTVVITGSFLVFQFIVIRTVARFIRRTEIELTQFGSIVEF